MRKSWKTPKNTIFLRKIWKIKNLVLIHEGILTTYYFFWFTQSRNHLITWYYTSLQGSLRTFYVSTIFLSL
jgi:hypothetical protein